jgi:hypothetical protein
MQHPASNSWSNIHLGTSSSAMANYVPVSPYAPEQYATGEQVAVVKTDSLVTGL